MRLPSDVVTVLVRRNQLNAPWVKAAKESGVSVWSNELFQATYDAIKKKRPDAPYKSMRDLYGKYDGQTVFICGSGPTLNDAPESFPGPTFAINRAISKVKADYWCFSDVRAWREQGEHPNAVKAEKCFGSALHLFFPTLPAYLIEGEGVPLRHPVEKRPLYWNGATLSWALHWAIRTGAKRIILVGCEFSFGAYCDSKWASGYSTDQPGVMQIARERMAEMFGPDRKQWADERPDVEILDAAPHGWLPLPKTDLKRWL